MTEVEEGRPRAPMGGRLAWWPFAAALVGVAVVVTVIVLVNALAGGGTTGSRQQGTGLLASGAVACPEFFEHADTPWVPARPAGVHPRNKLVPRLHPTHVTICAYRDPGVTTPKSLRLTGERQLTGKLDLVVDTLRTVHVQKTVKYSCADTAAAGDSYLLGLRYAEAIVWVSAPGESCLGSSNGSKSSHTNLSTRAAASYAARSWVSPPK